MQNVNGTFAGLTHPAVDFVVTVGQHHLEQFYQSVNKFPDLLWSFCSSVMWRSIPKPLQWTGYVGAQVMWVSV